MKTSEIDYNSPAIRALGSRFKLTEVFLQDDGYSIDDSKQAPYPKHIRFKYDDDDDDYDDANVDFGIKIRSHTSVETSEESVVMEDADLSQEMIALGLPLSFQTSKQQNNMQTKGKHKATHRKDEDSQSGLKDQVVISARLSEEIQSYAGFHDKANDSPFLSLPDQAELSCSGSDVSDAAVDILNNCYGVNTVDMAGETGYGDFEKLKHENLPRNVSCEALIDNLLGTDSQMEIKMMSLSERQTCCGYNVVDGSVEEQRKELDRSLMKHVDTKGTGLSNAMQLDDLDSSICIDQTQVAGLPIVSEMVLDHDANDNVNSSVVRGEWSAFWDSFYMRYYFCNSETQESTWIPPPGFEHFAHDDISNVFDKSSTEVNVSSVEPAIIYNDEEFDRHELVDKTGINGQIVDKVREAEGFTSADLSSGPTILQDIPSPVNVYEYQVHDEKCQDELTLSSSMSTINHNQQLKIERQQQDSSGMCTGSLTLKDLDSVVNSWANVDKNFNSNVVSQLSDASSLSSTVEAAYDDNLIDHVHMEEVDTVTDALCVQDTPAVTKQKIKRKNRRKKSFKRNDKHEFQPVGEYDVDITKYWCQRYFLFSKFDVGIQMDEEGWFSVTPEAIARHHASRSGGGIVIDCFAGVGGNVIQFAKTSKHVIAIDIDPNKIDYAHQNAAIYGVEDKIDFINGDSFSLAPKLKADAVFLSPPWGGPDYLQLKSYDISMLRPHDGQFLFNTFKSTASLIIMFLPRNVDIVQLAELSASSDSLWSLEVEKNFLNGKLKAVTAYFSKTS